MLSVSKTTQRRAVALVRGTGTGLIEIASPYLLGGTKEKTGKLIHVSVSRRAVPFASRYSPGRLGYQSVVTYTIQKNSHINYVRVGIEFAISVILYTLNRRT
jgi:hypothetical protein